MNFLELLGITPSKNEFRVTRLFSHQTLDRAMLDGLHRLGEITLSTASGTTPRFEKEVGCEGELLEWLEQSNLEGDFKVSYMIRIVEVGHGRTSVHGFFLKFSKSNDALLFRLAFADRIVIRDGQAVIR